jgi:hypothetical protein
MAGPWDLWYLRTDTRSGPPSIHWERKLQFYQRAAFVREWRTAFIQAATDVNLPKGLELVGIEVLPFTPTRSHQDAGNCLPAAKAGIDGLIARDEGYGLIPDDNPTHLRWLLMHASCYEKGVSGLWVRVHDLS